MALAGKEKQQHKALKSVLFCCLLYAHSRAFIKSKIVVF